MKNTRENKARQYMRVVSVCGVRAMIFYSAAAVFPNFQQSELMIGLYIRLKEVEGIFFQVWHEKSRTYCAPQKISGGAQGDNLVPYRIAVKRIG